MKSNPLRPSDTSPKSDSSIFVVIQSFHVGFGGGRRGSGVAARAVVEPGRDIESLRGRMPPSGMISEGERQAPW